MSVIQRLLPSDFKAALQQDKGIIIDVRTALELEAGYIQGAAHHDLSNGDFEQAIAQLDPSQTYYLYCRSGARSGRAAEMLASAGFPKVFNVGGFEELANAGFAVDYKD